MTIFFDYIVRASKTYPEGTLTPGVIKWGKSMRNKKRILLIIGVILFFGAAVAFGISRWYYWRGGSVMDGPGEFYSRMFRMYGLFLRIAIGLLVAGAVSIALDFLLKIVRRS